MYLFCSQKFEKKTALKSFVKLKSFIIEIQLWAFESLYYSGTSLVFPFPSFISTLICIFPAFFLANGYENISKNFFWYNQPLLKYIKQQQ